jgi:hypothetical protein
MADDTIGLYYKPRTIINDDSRVFTELETSLNDNARVVIYATHIYSTGHRRMR